MQLNTVNLYKLQQLKHDQMINLQMMMSIKKFIIQIISIK
jgi:hypothetical protein